MISTILTVIFSKLGGLVAGVLGVIGLVLWGKYHQRRAEVAEHNVKVAQAKVEISEARQEVKDETERDVEKIRQASNNGSALIDAYNRLCGDKSGNKLPDT